MCSSSELMRTYTKTDKNLVIVRLPCTGNNFRHKTRLRFLCDDLVLEKRKQIKRE